jgi:hypothetical protein
MKSTKNDIRRNSFEDLRDLCVFVVLIVFLLIDL